ncbi:MAG: substrate-binding domain-containing protein, partial [Pseudomonadota bacterium]
MKSLAAWAALAAVATFSSAGAADLPSPAEAGFAKAGRFITVASTTSTENSGLFGHILPLFTKKIGIEVRVVAVGTGQAIRLAERGDADVLFVHHQPSEE